MNFNVQNKNSNNLSSIRLRVLIFVSLFITLILVSRVIYLITIDPEKFMGRQNILTDTRRGDIYDRNGVLLAVSDELYSIYAHPDKIAQEEKRTYADKLSLVLDIPVNEILAKLEQTSSFVWIKRQVPYDKYIIIEDMQLSFIDAAKEFKRSYPSGKTASHILGFCNIDQIGLEGIESRYDQILSRQGSVLNETYLDTNNIVLTIDSFIQLQAEKALKNHAEINNPRTGALILMDGLNGEILAMSGFPDFNPNTYSQYNQSTFRNPAIFYQYEPGSVQKLFTMAAILDKNPSVINMKFYCGGQYEANGITVKCTGNHGEVDIGGILKYSCNTGTLSAMEYLSSENLFNYFEKMDFGIKTGIELPGEQQGIFRSFDQWSGRSRYAIPIGQEMSVNALQIVKAATIFLNNGQLLKPQIIKTVFTTDGRIVLENRREVIRQVISKSTAEMVLNSMQFATQSGGIETQLKVNNINFLAKSGTAQIFDSTTNRYSTTEVTSSLIAFFPAENPRYIVYGYLDRPKGETYWGGIIIGRMIKEFIENISGYLPIETYNTFIINQNSLVSETNNIEPLTGFPFIMPDIKGMTPSDVLYLFSAVNTNIVLKGQGSTVNNQNPAPGIVVNSPITIEVSLR